MSPKAPVTSPAQATRDAARAGACCCSTRRSQSSAARLRTAQRVGGAGGALEGLGVLRLVIEGLLVVRERLLRIHQLHAPDLAHLRQQRGALAGGHLLRGFGLRDLEGDVPLAAGDVDAAQLGERRVAGRVALQRAAVALGGAVEVPAPVSPDLAQAEEHASALPGRAREVRRAEAVLVETDERIPVAGDEVALLQRLEGAVVARIRQEALSMAFENR